MTLQVKYSHLCAEFLSVAQPYIDDNVLKVLKDNYASCINSNRRLSYIKDFNTLLRTLEKRDILNYCNIEPLSYISQKFVREPHLQSKLMDYEVSLRNVQCPPLYNMYQDENAASAPPLMEHESNDTVKVSNPTASCTAAPEVCRQTPSQSTSCAPQKLQDQYGRPTNINSCFEKEIMLRQMVLSRVSERFGRSWRDVARHLGVLEYQIDAIQSKHPTDLKEQSYEALKLYISQCNSDSWKLNLIRALEKGRRRDLKELVEELIMQIGHR